jgi:hypothetical protein
MSFVVSYDEKFGTPYSEVKLASGEHVFLTLDQGGLVIRLLARPGHTERVLFKGTPETVTKICVGLLDDRDPSKATPLQILVAVMTQMPHAAAVAEAFAAAAKE